MPTKTPARAILVLGPGPCIIGKSAMFDAFAVSALRALRENGNRIIALTSSAAARMADPAAAAATYIEPLADHILTEIIAAEAPDLIFPSAGGPDVLYLASRVSRSTGIPLAGTPDMALDICRHRRRLMETARALSIPVPDGYTVSLADEFHAVADTPGFPAVIRPDGVVGCAGGGIVYNMEELENIGTRALNASVTGEVLVQPLLPGYGAELQILRDGNGGTAVVAAAEYPESRPMNRGNGAVVTPFRMTETAARGRMIAAAASLAEKLKIRGILSVQFQLTEDGLPLLMDAAPLISRIAALAFAATGRSPAGMAALAAVGAVIDEIPGCRKLHRFMTGGGGLTAVGLPRFSAERMPEADDRFDITMRATGLSAGTGEDMTRAAARAFRALPAVEGSDAALPVRLDVRRYPRMIAALNQSLSPEKLAAETGLHPLFAAALSGISPDGGPPEPPPFISAPSAPLPALADDAPRVLLLGTGPESIGRGEALHANLIAAARALRSAGYRTDLATPAPWAGIGAPDVFDRIWICPVRISDLRRIPGICGMAGVLPQFGGPEAMALTGGLIRTGLRVFGPDSRALENLSADAVHDFAVSRCIPCPAAETAHGPEDLGTAAESVGYPVRIRFPRPGGGFRRMVLSEAPAAEDLPDDITGPIRVEAFLENAVEAEVDVLSDGERILILPIIEHVERAGVHSSDSAQVSPPLSLSPRQEDAIREYSRALIRWFGVTGLINIHFAIADDIVHLMRARAGASRTVPFLARLTGTDPAGWAALSLVNGTPLPEKDPVRPTVFGVKEASLPFSVFTEMDPVLGPDTISTGQVLGLSESFGRAFFKSQEAAGTPLPLNGTVLITIVDKDKPAILEPARQFHEMGFRLLATRGTRAFLMENGIACDPVNKRGYGRPDLIDFIKGDRVHLLINTPVGRRGREDDSSIRRASIRYGVPNITSAAAALAAARGIRARREGRPIVTSLQRLHPSSAAPKPVHRPQPA